MKFLIKYRAVISLILCTSLLTGCWDREEINDVAFVIGIAADKEGDEYRSSLQIALPGQSGASGSEGGGGGTNGDKPWFILSNTDRTLRGTTLKGQKSLSRRIYYAHRRTILIGEELARDGVAPMLDLFTRYPLNRLSALPVVTRGEAHKVMDTDAPIEKFPSEMVRELCFLNMRNPRSLKTFIDSILDEGVDPFLPIASVSDSVPEGWKGAVTNIKLDGLAIFKKDKLVGMMDKAPADALILAMGEANEPEVMIKAPRGKGDMFIKLNENNSSLHPKIVNGKVSVTIQMYAKGVLVDNESDYGDRREKEILNLNEAVHRKIKEDIEEGVRLVQKKFKADIIGIGRSIHRQLPKEWDKIKDRWEVLYPEVQVTVDPHVIIENVGIVNKPIGVVEEDIIHD
ncbi:spore germination protein KC [Paenibacillus intestini]|uniref:Ger(X)C family spore germination protein n=1 Tax=Paenibacillus cucumis (ex Kampfer et al. 2016) TaxID=1776858 RepID=A0ABS7KLX2_9BACL|nr:Ger(x)C family spore germination protein [Paenibacillus cucumis (ex Kampfer et al. 2016)]MBY0205173.1 Ger(x)C family spore germination protein [Paenibacillus cucumis (ex Kampfer et al. 2016)]MDP9700010.1 spore germination protein KC [Paenibacillus intestini]